LFCFVNKINYEIKIVKQKWYPGGPAGLGWENQGPAGVPKPGPGGFAVVVAVVVIV